MALKYECDSCGKLAHPSQPRPGSGNSTTLPDNWTPITVGGGTMHLCDLCTVMPMRFGNITFELTPPPQPRAAPGR